MKEVCCRACKYRVGWAYWKWVFSDKPVCDKCLEYFKKGKDDRIHDGS